MKQAKTGDNERKETAYPYYDLESAIKFSSHITELGGVRAEVTKSLLAKQVGLAESTPSFFQRLSSAKTFGIVQGWGSYGLTELGKKYFYPQTESDPKEAVLAMFATPIAFRFLLQRFDGDRLPSTEMVGNLLHSEMNVGGSWKDRVAQIFNRSAQFSGIIDSGGFLRYNAEMHMIRNLQSDDAPLPSGAAIAASPVPQRAVAPQTGAATTGISAWVFRQIRLETPEDLTFELWEKLNAYVQILKPSKDESKTE